LTPNYVIALLYSVRTRVCSLLWISLTYRFARVSSFVQYNQLPPVHLKADKCQVVFSGTSAPPEALRPPSQMFSEVWRPSTTSLQESWLERAVWIVLVSSTNENPLNLMSFPDIGLERKLPSFAVWSILRIGVETMAQITGPAPLPWQMPCSGIISYPLKEVSESPKAVRT